MANIMTFVKIENKAGKQILPVKGRVVSDLDLPKECKFYFFDSEYDTITEYRMPSSEELRAYR